MVSEPLTTPDGRYLIVWGRLWRKANPALPEGEHQRLVAELMAARRAVATARRAADPVAESLAHDAVNKAKVALERKGITLAAESC